MNSPCHSSIPLRFRQQSDSSARVWLGGPRVLGQTGLGFAWGAKGPGPGRLGFGLGGNLNGEVEGRVGGYIDNIIIL